MELKDLAVKSAQSMRTLMTHFIHDHCPMRAAGLSFISLLALVPLSAVVFSVFTASGAFESFYSRMQETIIVRIFPAAGEEIALGLRTFIENARSLGLPGLIFFIVTSVLLFNAVSRVFNTVWGCRYRKPFLARFTSYITVMVLGSLLLGAGISLTAVMGISEAPQIILEVLSQVFTCGVFLVLIFLVPSGKVQFSAALAGAVTGTVLWEVSRILFIYWTSSVMRVSVIYGSLAAVPILLLWLYVVWTITLFSLETAFVYQHRRKPVVYPLRGHRLPYDSVVGGMELFLFVARSFRRGEGPATLAECSRELSTAEEEIEKLAARLITAELLLPVSNSKEGYFPARPLDTIRVTEVITALFGRPEETSGPGGEGNRGVEGYIYAFLDAAAGAKSVDVTAEEILSAEEGEKL